MSYGDEANKTAGVESDEVNMGSGNELPVKAHFRRTENAWLYEKRGGQKTGRVLDMVSAFTKTVVRFAELNGPSHAELAYILAEQLAFIECNPKYTSETLALARNANGEYNADPKSKGRFAGALVKLAATMADLQMEFGHAATFRAMAASLMSLQDMPAHLRSIGPDSFRAPASEDPRQPFDYTGKSFPGLATKQPETIFDDLNEIADRLGIKRNGGSFVDQANTKLDRANATQSLGDDLEDPCIRAKEMATERVRGRWCDACRKYHSV